MWKRLLVLALLVQRKLISSEQVNEETENKRASRQLNFGDCCPCPGQDAFQEQGSAITRLDAASVGDDSCPCRSTPDSEGASSIFRPAFRAVDPFIRSVPKKEERKPLLNPEVGLASSVLETLREVTDQEYQEALARDAARSALKIMDPELSETEPRNLVNIILSPKEKNNDDIISEATEIQRSSCILPPLGTNTNEHMQLQPPMNLLNQLLTPPKISNNGISKINDFDMDGSASNTHKQILQPLKYNILDNLKTRSNLLNLRPLTNMDNRDFLTSPNILQKHYLKNNIRDRMLLRNRPLLDVQPETTNKLKELFARKTAGNNDKHDFNNSIRKLKVPTEGNILQNTDCMEIFTEPNQSPNDNLKNFDVVPSSSKIIEVKNSGTIENPYVIEQDREDDICIENVTDTNTGNKNLTTLPTITDINSSPKSSEITREVAEDSKFVEEQTNDSEIENTTEHLENLKDMESEPSITRNIVRNLQDAANMEYNSSTENESKQINSVSQKNLMSSTSAGKDMIDSEINPLPNIKADIYRTLENFKKAHDKIQQKLRSNVHDALQLAIPNESHHSLGHPDTEPHNDICASSVEPTQELKNNVTTTKKYMTTQDLQKMSDSLLSVELISFKNNSETSTTSYKNEESKEESEYKSAEIDNNNDMITSPTTLIVKNNINNSKDEKSNLNTIDEHINKIDETVGNVCDNDIISKNSGSSKTNNEDNEMTAQPSNSVFNSISQLDLNPSKSGLLQRDFIVQPEHNIRPMKGITDFFNNFRSSGTDTFTNDDGDSIFFSNQPRFGFRNDNNNDPSKTITILDYMPKFDSGSNLSSYKAKVVSPKSLDIKSPISTFPLSSNKEADILGLASQGISHISNLKNVVKNNIGNGLNPLFEPVHNPTTLQNKFSSLVPSISEQFQSHTNNAFKGFRDSLGLAEREPFTINKKNFLGETLINSDNLFGAMLKTHENFNDKLQAFHSDLNKRLSSLSPKISSDGSRLLWPSNRLKNSRNRAELNNISNRNIGTVHVKTKSPFMKNTLLLQNKPIIESIKKKTADTALRPHLKDLGTKKRPITINTPKSYLNKIKTPLNNIKLKPHKENKVTISFSTTSIRPDTLKSGIKSLQPTNSLRSRSTGAPLKLPKFSKSLADKKAILKSKLESNDPKVSASDITISKAQLHDTSPEESVKLHNRNQNYDDRRSANKEEANKRKTLLLSKIKNAFASGASSEDMKRINKVLSTTQNENGLDATQSASNTIDTSISAISLAEQTLKDNQSFKCKMVCIKDILDSTDT